MRKMKDAFLLSDLPEDIKHLSELNELTEPIISNTRTLKIIIGKFSDDKCLIVHSSYFERERIKRL